MRAFILGNGPSLKDTPLDLLIGETTFAMNRINLYWQVTHRETRWRPTYYFAFDWTGPDMVEDVVVNVTEARHSFLRADRAGDIEMRLRRFEWPSRITYFWPRCDHLGLNYEGAMHDPVLAARLPKAWHLPSVCSFGSTLHIAMQVAVLMGYNPIFLLGCDLGFKDFAQGTPDPNHFDPGYIGFDDFPWADRDTTLVYTHDLMERETRQRGVEIINCSSPSALDGIHRRASLPEALGVS
jgi:hypothetical protein